MNNALIPTAGTIMVMTLIFIHTDGRTDRQTTVLCL